MTGCGAPSGVSSTGRVTSTRSSARRSGQFGRGDLGVAGLESGAHRAARPADPHAGVLARLRRQSADLTVGQGERRPVAGVGDPGCFELGHRGRGGEGPQRLRPPWPRRARRPAVCPGQGRRSCSARTWAPLVSSCRHRAVDDPVRWPKMAGSVSRPQSRNGSSRRLDRVSGRQRRRVGPVPSAPLGERAGVEADRRGGTQIEALGLAVDRDRDESRRPGSACSGASPRASLPNSQAVGSASRPSASRSARSISAPAGGGPDPQSGPATGVQRLARSTPITIGRWNRLPALARTVFGLYRSTEAELKITASAPAASAHRITVPALPGSRISAQQATSLGAVRAELRPARHPGADRGTADGDQALRSDRVGQLAQLIGCRPRPQSRSAQDAGSAASAVPNTAVTRSGNGKRLSNGLRSFGQEQPLLDADPWPGAADEPTGTRSARQNASRSARAGHDRNCAA